MTLLYLVLGTLSGTSPGTQVAPGLTLPLNWDGLTTGLLDAVNTPLLVNGFGSLDQNGTAQAKFNLPPGLGLLSGKTIHWSALGATPASQFLFVTNASALVLLP